MVQYTCQNLMLTFNYFKIRGLFKELDLKLEYEPPEYSTDNIVKYRIQIQNTEILYSILYSRIQHSLLITIYIVGYFCYLRVV